LSLGSLFFYFFEFQNVTDIDEMHVHCKYIRCVALRTFTVPLAAKQTRLTFTSSRTQCLDEYPNRL